MQSKWKEALTAFSRALGLYEEYVNLSKYIMTSYDLTYSSETNDSNEESNSDMLSIMLAKIHINIGVTNFKLQRVEPTISHLTRAVTLLDEILFERGTLSTTSYVSLIRALVKLGSAYFAAGDLEEGSRRFSRAIAMAESGNKKRIRNQNVHATTVSTSATSMQAGGVRRSQGQDNMMKVAATIRATYRKKSAPTAASMAKSPEPVLIRTTALAARLAQGGEALLNSTLKNTVATALATSNVVLEKVSATTNVVLDKASATSDVVRGWAANRTTIANRSLTCVLESMRNRTRKATSLMATGQAKIKSALRGDMGWSALGRRVSHLTASVNLGTLTSRSKNVLVSLIASRKSSSSDRRIASNGSVALDTENIPVLALNNSASLILIKSKKDFDNEALGSSLSSESAAATSGTTSSTIEMQSLFLSERITEAADVLVKSSDAATTEVTNEFVGETIREISKDTQEETEAEISTDSQNETVPEHLINSQDETVPEHLTESQDETVPEHLTESQDDSVPEHLTDSQDETVTEHLTESQGNSVPEHLTDSQDETVPENLTESVPEHLTNFQDETAPEHLSGSQDESFMATQSNYSEPTVVKGTFSATTSTGSGADGARRNDDSYSDTIVTTGTAPASAAGNTAFTSRASETTTNNETDALVRASAVSHLRTSTSYCFSLFPKSWCTRWIQGLQMFHLLESNNHKIAPSKQSHMDYSAINHEARTKRIHQSTAEYEMSPLSERHFILGAHSCTLQPTDISFQIWSLILFYFAGICTVLASLFARNKWYAWRQWLLDERKRILEKLIRETESRALSLFQCCQFDFAERLITESMPDIISSIGEEHVDTLHLKHLLANCKRLTNKYNEACDILKAIVPPYRLLGEDYHVARVTEDLGLSLYGLGLYDDAAQCLRDALDIFSREGHALNNTHKLADHEYRRRLVSKATSSSSSTSSPRGDILNTSVEESVDSIIDSMLAPSLHCSGISPSSPLSSISEESDPDAVSGNDTIAANCVHPHTVDVARVHYALGLCFSPRGMHYQAAREYQAAYNLYKLLQSKQREGVRNAVDGNQKEYNNNIYSSNNSNYNRINKINNVCYDTELLTLEKLIKASLNVETHYVGDDLSFTFTSEIEGILNKLTEEPTKGSPVSVAIND